MKPPVKIVWLERAKATHNFHVKKRRQDKNWKIRDTAKALLRSIGSITEDLKIASWMRTHVEELRRFDYAYEALNYIREREEFLELKEID